MQMGIIKLLGLRGGRHPHADGPPQQQLPEAYGLNSKQQGENAAGASTAESGAGAGEPSQPAEEQHGELRLPPTPPPVQQQPPQQQPQPQPQQQQQLPGAGVLQLRDDAQQQEHELHHELQHELQHEPQHELQHEPQHEQQRQPPNGAAAAAAGPALARVAGVQHAASAAAPGLAGSASSGSLHDEDLPPIVRTSSSSAAAALAAHSRRASLLSECGRASRRSSLMSDSLTDGTDSLLPPILQQQPDATLLRAGEPPPAADDPSAAARCWAWGSHSDQNQRAHMEDRVAAADLTAHPALGGLAASRAGFFAVFDGHGGHEAAEYLEAHLLSYVLDAGAAALGADPLGALGAAVRRAEAEVLSTLSCASCNAGSTLLAALLLDDALHIAHVGDSRAVLGRGGEACQLTRDHKPACSREAARIAGDDPAADISPDGYIYGELAVSRAIGSAHLKRDPSKRALIPTPDLLTVPLRPDDDFVLLATDGLWDRVDNAEAVGVARRSLAGSGPGRGGADAAARALVDRALRRASSDNISVVALLLHGRPISLPKSNSMLFRRAALSGLGGGAGGGGGGGGGGAGGADSPRCSTPVSGLSTPATATPRSGTPTASPGPPVAPPVAPLAPAAAPAHA